MKIWTVKCHLNNGQDIKSYPREVEFLVRQIDSYEDGSKSHLIKSPCGKLYEFAMMHESPEELITLIQEGKVEQYAHSRYESIFVENPVSL